MGWIIVAICIIAFMVYFFCQEYGGGIDVGGTIASVLLGGVIGVMCMMLVCGLGSIIADDAGAKTMIISQETYELAPNYSNGETYIMLSDSNWEYVTKNEFGQLTSDSVAVISTNVQFSEVATPSITTYHYDFASPVMRFIFWNPIAATHIITIPPDGALIGPTVN